LELAQSITDKYGNMTHSASALAHLIANEYGNMTQSTSALAQSVAEGYGNMTQSTLTLAQSANGVNDDDRKPGANAEGDFDNEVSRSTIALTIAQSATLESDNLAQSTLAFAQSRIGAATNTELAAKLNELSLIPQVRQTNVPSFIVHSLCI
jgi:hypothetical protein